MPLPDLLPSNPPPLSSKLRCRTTGLRSRIIRKNYNTKFAQTAPELTDFRQATANLVDGMDDDTLSDSFRRTVHFTTYDSYAPFVTRFFEKPCKVDAVVDLLAPGLPDFLMESSSTSGGLPKTFPKTDLLSEIRSSDAGPWTISDPLRRRTAAHICWLGCDPVVIEDDDSPVARIYRSGGSSILQRMIFHLDPEKDEEMMGTIILDHVAPHAAGFIKKWRSFLLIHALFAVSSGSLESMNMTFINTFVDFIRHLDAEFDMVVDCISNGTIPDLDGVAAVRHHLEPNITSDPARAAELRLIGRPSSRPGWCGHIWPNLRSVTAIASGVFASSVPLAQWFLGPDIEIHAYGYGTTECWIGPPYDPLEMNRFKMNISDSFEFLDVSKRDATSVLTQSWEVERGRHYELVLTTRDGLWRYRLGDVVEICGFDPTDGIPVLSFVERRSMAIRFPDFAVTEKELRSAMSSLAPDMLANVVNWTSAIDDRCVPATIGFFVELADYQVSTSDLVLSPQHLLDELLQSNKNVGWAVAHDLFPKPTIRILRPGTFSEFLQLKLDEGSDNVGQIKVPVVLPKPAYVVWFLDRVVQEV